MGEGEWKRKKHGAQSRRQWRKLHIGIDAQTMQLRTICVTSNNVSDAAVVPDLLAQVPENEAIASFTGDGAYDTQPVYEAVMQRGAIPIVPPRKNARMRKGAMFAYRNDAIGVLQAIGARDMENLERLPPEKFGANQDELHQAAGRAGNVTYLRAPGQ